MAKIAPAFSCKLETRSRRRLLTLIFSRILNRMMLIALPVAKTAIRKK
ncbi:MAG: hypothetical protein ACREAB_17100 [Blastocatellia bacterium]